VSVDSLSFRRALGQFPSGVTVVTTRGAGGEPVGLTVSSFCSVSLHPPLVLVCIDRRSDANDGLRDSRHFAVSVLSEEQQEVSRRFAAPGRGKLEGFAFLEGRHGLPLVPGALAHVQCKVRSRHEEGDHLVWVGEVIALAAHPGRPLLYHAGGYHVLDPGRRGSKPGGDRV
jgi:flavin reductase (DIM6/NTAB) family NADH-FMN oxidoreductase RutF